MKPRTVALAAAATLAALAPAPAALATSAPKVSVTVPPIAAALSTTKAATTKIAVANVGSARATGLRVTVASPRGVRVRVSGAKRSSRRTRALAPVRAGRTVRVGVTLRRTKSGPKAGALTVKVTRKGKTLATSRLTFGPASATTPPPNPNSLAGRLFWGSLYTLNGIQQYWLYFTGPNLVSTEAGTGAWPACTAVSDVCKPYTYDAGTNVLTIDGKPVTLAGRTLTLDGQSHGEFGYPAPGARWDGTLTYSNSSGICPLYCSYYTENLTFRGDGTFLRDAVASGTGPIVDWAAVPADRKGTYEVRPDHTLLFAFADGTQRLETVAQYLNDDGSLKAPSEGLLLGGDGYFDISD